MQRASGIAVVDDQRFDAHRERHGSHPERPDRLSAARSGLYSVLTQTSIVSIAPRPASDAELLAVHQDAYVHQLRQKLTGGFGQLDADTYFSPGTQEAAWCSAGGAAALAHTLMQSETTRGIALLRPPGHHAEADHAMGFCFFNNVAVAAHAALDAGAKRVAIIDWDVHHGNGTQHAFYHDARVLFVSLHQYPFYPGTGRSDEIGSGEGRGFTANIALPADQGPETYGYAFRQLVLPLLEQFRADIVLVSAGFDAHRRDPLAEMQLDAETYQSMTTALLDHVSRAGHARLGLLLEGGYDLQALESSMAHVARALIGQQRDLPEGAPPKAGVDAIEYTRSALAPFWRFPERA